MDRVIRRVAKLAIISLALAGCYNPALEDCTLTCTAATGCPSGFSCAMGVCRPEGATGGCPTAIDANNDAAPDAAGGCYGTGLLRPCFATTPAGAIDLRTDIDTTTMVCTDTVNSIPACVIAGDTIVVSNRVVVTGNRPLVLVGVSEIIVTSDLDASSRHAQTAPFATMQIGAASNVMLCPGGTAPSDGGGAGGSLGSSGGNGGEGGTATAGDAAGGFSGGTPPAANFRGGCDGQAGSGTLGRGGRGGGALYLISTAKIEIGAAGRINASGEGGGRGVTSDASGGGGGSGGMIVLDAPAITNAGLVVANGGGGGGGAGTEAGRPGDDVSSGASAQGGAGASSGGGAGGAGASLASPGNGGVSTNPATRAGGGGGGGGAGIIRVTGGGTLTGTVSPAPI